MNDLAVIIQQHSDPDGRVFAVLHEIQAKFGYIPKDVLKEVSGELNIPLTQLYGVVTFYAGFNLKPRGEHVINICHGTVCHVKGSTMLAEAVEQELGIRDGETSPNGKFTFESVRCLGCCSLAPVIAIDGEIFGNLDRDKIQKLLRLLKEGKSLEGFAATPESPA